MTTARQKRETIPDSVRRAVLHEAGYRCAVPTCGTILLLDLHHIIQVSEGGGNLTGNLVALCPNCHALYHRGKIPQNSITQWKALLVERNKADFGIQRLREVAISLWRENFPALRNEAMATAQDRVELFLADLEKHIQANLTPEQINRFKLPEVQHTFAQSLQASATRPAPELRNILASLVVRRVKAYEESLESIVYGEAVKTVAILTPEMLNTLALKTYLVLSFRAFETWEGLKEAHAKYISPLLGFPDTSIYYQHLVSSGCGTFGGMVFGATGLIALLRANSPTLLQQTMQEGQIRDLKLNPELVELLFRPGVDGGLRFRCKTLKEVKEICAAAVDHANSRLAAVPNLFEAILGTEQENTKLILQKLPEFDAALKQVSVGLTNFFQISAIGLAIGAIHLEAKTGLTLVVNFQSPTLESENTGPLLAEYD